ncbi:MAG: DUF1918 domain-containing protein [Thermoleophilia bacterium]
MGNSTEGRLHAVRVRDVMTTELVTCTSDVPLAEVAELILRHQIHSLVVLAPPAGDPDGEATDWSVLTGVDLVASLWSGELGHAGSIAALPRVVVDGEASVADAARVMSENATTHVVVVDDRGDPIGIISTLDLARVLISGGEGQPQPETAHQPARVHAGDRLVIAAHHQGGRPRDAEVLEVRGEDGGPPFLVRWQDTGRVSIHYPGSDATVQRLSSGG